MSRYQFSLPGHLWAARAPMTAGAPSPAAG